MCSRADQAAACFLQGFNCSQAVLSVYCEELGLDRETALKLACGLGAGMGRRQETCGAVSGAYLVIGLKCGKFMEGSGPDGDPAKEKTYALVREFARRFEAKNGSTNCRALFGMDMQCADREIVAERVKIFCTQMVRDAVEVLEGLL